MDYLEEIRSEIATHTSLVVNLMYDEQFQDDIRKVVRVLLETIANGNKILIAGNGGSASDAQHIAGELVGQFHIKDRPSIPAIALTCDASVVTSIGNDRSFEEIYSRQVEGLGNQYDALLLLSTSGNSSNLIKAAKVAKDKNIKIIGMLGNNGGRLSALCDYTIIVPSDKCARIQEVHMMIYHIICRLIEQEIIDDNTLDKFTAMTKYGY